MKIKAPFKVGKPKAEERRKPKKPCGCKLHIYALHGTRYLITEFVT